MSVINNNLLLTSGDAEGYQISRSVRLRSSASAYFNRTPASAGSRTTWTMSMWLKRGAFSASNSSDLFTINNGTTDATYFVIAIRETDKLRIEGYNTIFRETTQVLRDVSAWYHLVVTADTTNGTAGNRIKMYLNGAEITAFSTSNNPTSSQSLGVNQAATHKLGSLTSTYLDGYLTEINFIDGQALTPSNFGETDAITGVWKPKRYAGTYGTNGFYLNFSDNSAATAAAIGKDSSGNGNNWTPNNISVTSGVTYDSMLDVPTMYADGGNGRGNYAVLNPVNKTLYQPTISDGNLTVAPTTTQYQNVFSTFAPTSGKWYCEVTVNGTANSANMIGVSSATEQNYLTTNAGLVGITSTGYGYYIYNGNKYTNGSASAYGDSIASGNVVGIALDLDNGKVFFSKNGTWQASGDPVAGTNAAFTGLTSSLGFFISSSSYSGGATSFNHNFGQRPFAHTPPTGFNALNTQNLPDATIKKGNAYFDVSTWTGDQAARTITNSGAFQPDLIWTKSRSDAESHRLHDAVRGGNGSVLYELNSNETAAEGTDTLVSGVASNGFTIASGTNSPNITGRTYVGWQWKAGGSAVSNTNGSITSSVSAGATQGFSVVTYTGTGSNATVGHGLGVAPKMLILKQRNAVDYWPVYHASLANTEYVLLNSTNGKSPATTYWNSTSPTSTVFSLGTDNRPNGNGTTMVAYCFAEVAGYSKFGSYTGNGSADGAFVFTGFRPRFVMVKRTDSTGEWGMWDTGRNTYNASTSRLSAQSSAAELNQAATTIDVLSNGFKIRTADTDSNGSGATYIYAAFAESPFRYSLAR